MKAKHLGSILECCHVDFDDLVRQDVEASNASSGFDDCMSEFEAKPAATASDKCGASTEREELRNGLICLGLFALRDKLRKSEVGDSCWCHLCVWCWGDNDVRNREIVDGVTMG